MSRRISVVEEVKTVTIRNISEAIVPVKIRVGGQYRIHPSTGLLGLQEQIVEVKSITYWQDLSPTDRQTYLDRQCIDSDEIDDKELVVNHTYEGGTMLMELELFANSITMY